MIPDHFKALFNRGYCFDRMGNLDLARRDYLSALVQKPKNVNIHHHLASLYDK